MDVDDEEYIQNTEEDYYELLNQYNNYTTDEDISNKNININEIISPKDSIEVAEKIKKTLTEKKAQINILNYQRKNILKLMIMKNLMNIKNVNYKIRY